MICHFLDQDLRYFALAESLVKICTGKILNSTAPAGTALTPFKLLVANSVEDVKNITHVFNYDYPNNSEDYVHRIGRTGRAGSKGTAITLFTTDSKCNIPYAAEIC